MTKEEYKQHLCTVIAAVLKAQANVLGSNHKAIYLDYPDFLSLIADEMLSATPEDELKQIIAQEP